MIGVDLFSGAGGMSVGASMAGVDVRCAVENDAFAATTFIANHPKSQIIQADIRSVKKIEIKSQDEPLVVFGGPPCQGFSTSNQRTRSLINPNNWLFQEFIRHVVGLRPDYVILENVKGLSNTEGGIFYEKICNQISDLGYSVTASILNASDFGVPQARSRLFIVGCLSGNYQFPTPSNSKKVTVTEAINDLPKTVNGSSRCELVYSSEPNSPFARKMRKKNKNSCRNNLVTRNADFVIDRYKHVPQGGNWENIPEELMSNYTDRTRCHTGIYHRLRGDRPSVVLGNYRKNMLIHPTEDRGLSVREAARLQSFPDDFVFQGSIGYQQQQVGNAVPPLLAKAVFSNLFQR